MILSDKQIDILKERIANIMKRKYILIALAICTSLMFGCKAKEDNSVADNLVNEDPTKITGEYADMINSKPPENKDSVFAGLSTEGVSDNTVGDVSSDSVDVSEEEVVFDDSMIVKDVPAERIDNTSENYNETEEISLHLYNLCGHDLDKIYVTVGELSLNNTDILGFEDLPDGRDYTYSIGEFSGESLSNEVSIKIVAVTKKGENIDFGEVKILNLNNIMIDLYQNKDGYYLVEE